MNELYNFNPDEKRMALAALLQNSASPYQRYKGPMGSPSSAGMMGGLSEMMKYMKRSPYEQAPSPVDDRSTMYDPASQYINYEG